MLVLYQSLADTALAVYPDLIVDSIFIGGTAASPNKLRLILMDGSFLDIWLSADGDYAYQWEQRRQSGRLYRWDNAPHYPGLSTFPDHFHEGDENTVVESKLSAEPEQALREVLAFVREQLAAKSGGGV